MKAPLTEAVAGQVRAEMARARITGTQLAEKIGRTGSYVARRLNGAVAFDTDDLAAIAEVLRIDVVDLIPTPERAA